MPGRMHYFNGQFTKFETTAVFADVRFVCLSVRRAPVFFPGRYGPYKISMKNVFPNILDAGLSFGSHAGCIHRYPDK